MKQTAADLISFPVNVTGAMWDPKEISKLPTVGANTIRFFKKGGVYYALDSDAEMIASKHIRSIGALKESNYGGKYVTINDSLYASLLKDLLLYNHKSIELFEFEDGKWSRTISASPGNVLPVLDIISADFDISTHSTLLAVNFVDSADGIKVDAATCDPTLYTIATTDFIEKNSCCFFETLLTQTMPSEIVLGGVPDRLQNKVKEIIEKFGITYKTGEMAKTVDCRQFPPTKSLKFLLSSLNISLSEFSHRPFKLYEFMTIDLAAATALNLFPDGEVARSGKPTSIFQLMNNCVTPMGTRLLQQYMMQPLLSPDGINQRLNIVQAFVENVDARIRVREVMKRLPDIARLMRKFISNKATLQDCVKLFDVTNVVEKFDFLSEGNVPEFAEFVKEIQEQTGNAENVKNLIEQTIDFALIPQHIYRIKPVFDPELQETSEQIDAIKAKMEAKRVKIAAAVGVDDEKLKLERTNNGKTFFFRLPRSLEPNIRGDSSLTIIEARANGVHFKCKSLDQYVEEITELEKGYSEKQREIQHKLIETLLGYNPVFEKLCDVFAMIDIYSSFAETASSGNYVRPVMSADLTELNLVQARHPLLEKHVSFIPNNVTMKKGESSFIIISGPNSAGKSTLLKTVGCCVYMAHIGSFVPCEMASIPIIPSIHARVGAWDMMNMSTFAVEMTEIASILESASERSLVIVDELGRSTSCSDGFGLAWAISKRLAVNIGAFCLFATHFHELCHLEEEIPCVKNYHMEADTEDCLRMCYKFEKGPFGDSFGIEAAARAGFKEEVMAEARKKVRQLELIDQAQAGSVKPRAEVKDFNRPYQSYFTEIKQQTYDLGALKISDLRNILTEANKHFEEANRKLSYEPVE